VKNTKLITVTASILLLGLGIGFYAGFLASASPISQTTGKLIIAIQPTETATEVTSRAEELEKYLESRLGTDVQIYVPTSYSAVVEALRFNRADVALMSAWPSFIANRLAGAETVLAEVRAVTIDGVRQDETFYFSQWIVMKDSSFLKLEDLRGRRACFPSPISTSGYLFPVAKLTELQLLRTDGTGEVDPRTFFGDVLFGGGYGQCWAALRNGQVDVSIITGDVSETLYQEVLENTRTLEKQGPIPSHGVVFSKNLKEPLRSKLIEAFKDLGRPEYKNLMRKLVSGIFQGFKQTSTDEHFAGLEKALELTGFKYTERIG
jgi:phosphonate transport system substrate-binding protein